MRKLLAALTVFLLLPAACRAEVYTAVTAAAYTIAAEAESFTVEAGQTVCAGDKVGFNRASAVFASEDGTVASVRGEAGNAVSGTVLEIMPVEMYAVYCKSQGATVHMGAKVYIKCTKNGTHRAWGILSNANGNEFRVLTEGGELQPGETVYVYSDADFDPEGKLGIGTAVVNDTLAYEAEGTLIEMCVRAGEYVEKGELLFKTVNAGSETVTAGADGIVMFVEEGRMTVAPYDALCVELTVPEEALADLAPGTEVRLIYAENEEDENCTGTVTAVLTADGSYTVRILPSKIPDPRLGMTVTVITE